MIMKGLLAMGFSLAAVVKLAKAALPALAQ